MKSIANILSVLGLAAEPKPITLDLKAMPDPIALGLAAQLDPMAWVWLLNWWRFWKDRKQIKGSQILNLSKSHKCHFFPLSFTCLLNVHALLVRCLKMHGNECYYYNLMKIIIMYLWVFIPVKIDKNKKTPLEVWHTEMSLLRFKARCESMWGSCATCSSFLVEILKLKLETWS